MKIFGTFAFVLLFGLSQAIIRYFWGDNWSKFVVISGRLGLKIRLSKMSFEFQVFVSFLLILLGLF